MVFSVAMVSTWVWPRVKRPEPWTRGMTPTWASRGRISFIGAAVHPFALEQPLLDDLLLDLVNDLVIVALHVGVRFLVFLQALVPPLHHTGLPDVLVVGVHAVLHALHLVFAELGKERLVKGGVLVGELLLADLPDHGVDEVQDALDLLVGLDNALVHDVPRGSGRRRPRS